MIKKRVGMLLNIRTGVICGLTILIWLVLIDINYEICVEIVLTQHDNILVNYHHYSRPPSFRALEREREREMILLLVLSAHDFVFIFRENCIQALQLLRNFLFDPYLQKMFQLHHWLVSIYVAIFNFYTGISGH